MPQNLPELVAIYMQAAPFLNFGSRGPGIGVAEEIGGGAGQWKGVPELPIRSLGVFWRSGMGGGEEVVMATLWLAIVPLGAIGSGYGQSWVDLGPPRRSGRSGRGEVGLRTSPGMCWGY